MATPSAARLNRIVVPRFAVTSWTLARSASTADRFRSRAKWRYHVPSTCTMMPGMTRRNRPIVTATPRMTAASRAWTRLGIEVKSENSTRRPSATRSAAWRNAAAIT